MKLKILLPDRVLLETEATRIRAEGIGGCFGLLERHVDVVDALVPGLLHWEDPAAVERFAAVDAGILVKVGPEVLVSVRRAAIGPDLGSLRRMVEEDYQVLDERERVARSAAARLEAGLLRRFLELDPHGR